jgi:glutathione S-transferase
MIGTLYGGPLTLPTAVVRVVLAEKSLPFNFVEIPWSPASGYTPVHPMIEMHHPDQKNPVWVDDHVALYDSFLICTYLEDRFDPVGALPAAAAERAKSRALFHDASRHLFPLIEKLVQARVYQRSSAGLSGTEVADTLASFVARTHHAADVGHYELNALRASTGDLAAATLLSGLAFLAGGLPRACDDLLPWFEQMKQRPSLASVFNEMAVRGLQTMPTFMPTPN